MPCLPPDPAGIQCRLYELDVIHSVEQNLELMCQAFQLRLGERNLDAVDGDLPERQVECCCEAAGPLVSTLHWYPRH